MKDFALAIALLGALTTPVFANEWKVRDVTVDPKSDQSKLMLVVSKTGIQIVRRATGAAIKTIDPKNVVSIWYDDKLVDGSLGRKWAGTIVDMCRAYCDDQNLMAPLVMLAVAGAGYLAVEPFSKRQHVVNIRYREGELIEWLTLGINWVDHVWLMEDLSKVTGLKWLNMPLQRTKLFWSWGDHTYQFQPWWATGDVAVRAGPYDVVLWEDGKGKGILIVFTKSGAETPEAVAVEPVVIEALALPRAPVEYCRDEKGVQRLVRIGLKNKRLVLPVWDAACRRATAAAQSPPAKPTGDVFAFVRALDEAGTRDVWPGFNTSQLPIALFDGEQTILLRHPSPPPEFSPMPGRPGVLVAPGRYPAVVSNSTRDIGGVRTATVLATPEQAVESTLLACVEEVFHVFWLGRHPSFRPDEMARYAYPVKDVENLRSLLAEDEALARALEVESDEEAAQWAAAALQLRRNRTPRLADDARAFETALEMMEGTANYAARRAVGESPAQTAARLRKERSAEAVRWRFYDTGTALCLLLDRFEPGWKNRIEAESDLTTFDLLRTALSRRGVEPKSFSTIEVAGFEARAAADVADLAGRQQQLRKELLDRPGSRVVVEVSDGAEPFRVQRFDPINLQVLDAGEVVHAAFITLTGANGMVEVNNQGFARNSFAGMITLTAAAGRHPLRDGIRRMTIVGLKGAPRVGREDGTITLDAPGLRVVLTGAEVSTDAETIHLTVLPKG